MEQRKYMAKIHVTYLLSTPSSSPFKNYDITTWYTSTFNKYAPSACRCVMCASMYGTILAAFPFFIILYDPYNDNTLNRWMTRHPPHLSSIGTLADIK